MSLSVLKSAGTVTLLIRGPALVLKRNEQEMRQQERR